MSAMKSSLTFSAKDQANFFSLFTYLKTFVLPMDIASGNNFNMAGT